MRLPVIVIAVLMSAIMLTSGYAQEPGCRIVSVNGPSYLETCGTRLLSFSLGLRDWKRTLEHYHGAFYFVCPVEPMCEGEPTLSGFLTEPEVWRNSAQDERAIYEVLSRFPRDPVRPPGPMPEVVCPVYDISVGGLAGRAVCFHQLESKSNIIGIVAADDHDGVVLLFALPDKSAAVLRDKVSDMVSRLEIEHATGDVALLKWIR